MPVGENLNVYPPVYHNKCVIFDAVYHIKTNIRQNRYMNFDNLQLNEYDMP